MPDFTALNHAKQDAHPPRCLSALRRLSLAVSAAAALMLPAQGAFAASAQGDYAVIGIGSLTCKAYLEQLSTENPPLLAYSEWVSGYLSGLNRTLPDTFDASYISDNTHLAKLVGRVCRTQPDQLTETVLAQLVTSMMSAELTQYSDVVRVSVGNTAVAIRRLTLDRLIGVLVEQDYLPERRAFDETVRDALIRFQADKNLTQTGLPDTETLIVAFMASS